MIPEDLRGRDWREAFKYAREPMLACRHVAGHAVGAGACDEDVPLTPFGREDVRWVIVVGEGEPHRRPWIGVFQLADGRFASVRARCCGEGWRCHREGRAYVARTLAAIMENGLTDEDRARLGL